MRPASLFISCIKSIIINSIIAIYWTIFKLWHSNLAFLFVVFHFHSFSEIPSTAAPTTGNDLTFVLQDKSNPRVRSVVTLIIHFPFGSMLHGGFSLSKICWCVCWLVSSRFFQNGILFFTSEGHVIYCYP